MGNGSGGADASVLFNLDGFKVVAHTMRDGEWCLLIETTQTRSGCPSCGVIGIGNGRHRVLVRDLGPHFDHPPTRRPYQSTPTGRQVDRRSRLF